MFSRYVLILVWIGLMAVLSYTGKFTKIESVCGCEEYRQTGVFAFVVFVPVILMAAFRGYFGDTGAYIRGFQAMPSSIFRLGVYLASVTKDKGFSILAFFIKSVIGNKTTLYLFILALLQGISLVVFFRKYSMNYILSIFLFVASTDYLSWMFNGIRQFMAVTIILFATPFMLKKKYIPAIFIILLASTMHQSALLMIPFMFIAQGEVWNQKTILFIGLSLLAIVFVGQFTNLLDDALANTQYATVVSDYTSWNDDGTNPLRVLVYSVPALLAFTGRERIRSEGSALINLCANMSIISMGLYLVSMVTSGVFIGRLPIYCSLYGYILLPWEIENCFTEESHRLAMSLVIVFYMLFYGFQLKSWGIM